MDDDETLENGHFESSEIPELRQCNQPKVPSVCSACRGCIFDQSFLLMAGETWHSECLKCSVCSVPLDAAHSCFFKDGSIFCKEDYYKKHYIHVCDGCGHWISSNDKVQQVPGLVYHAACFLCTACKRLLVTGENFKIDEGVLYCWNCLMPTDCYDNMNVINPAFGGFYSEEPRSKSTRKKKNSLPTDPVNGMPFGVEYCDQDQSGVFQRQKTKRMRTSFKHHQLKAMKDYFNINHNPDAKDLKQLAHETGLTKRVLQVWFQNARAKYRRGKTTKEIKKNDPNSKEKSENESDSVSTLEEEKHLGGESQNGIDRTSEADVRPDSEREEAAQPPSSCASEVSTSSPEMSNFSSGDSRPDTAERSTSAIQWAYEGCSTSGQCQIPTLILPELDPTNMSYTCADLELEREQTHRSLLYHDSHGLSVPSECYQMTCAGGQSSATGMYYPISQ